MEFDLKSVNFDLKSVNFDLKNVDFNLKFIIWVKILDLNRFEESRVQDIEE